jgi:predicted NUDIX family NTP pyrophosphohydrolase
VKRSAGILVYRHALDGLRVLLVHPGGPFWRRKDAGAWSIPKGEIDPGEDSLAAAVREFAEETGIALAGDFLPLGNLTQAGGKHVMAWAFCGEVDAAAIRSNTFTMEWPPKSERQQSFPEIDRAEWFDLPTAQAKILASQRPFLDRLAELLQRSGQPATHS